MGYVAGAPLLTGGDVAIDAIEFHTFGPFQSGVHVRDFTIASSATANNTELLVRAGVHSAPPIVDAAFNAGELLQRFNTGDTELILRLGTQVTFWHRWPLGWEIESPARFVTFRLESLTGASHFVLGLYAGFDGFDAHTPLRERPRR